MTSRTHQQDRAALTDLAHAQRRVALRAQLIEAGVPERTISHRCRSGRWQTTLPGVVALHSGPLGWEHRYRSALLYAGRRRAAPGTAGHSRPPGRSSAPTGPRTHQVPHHPRFTSLLRLLQLLAQLHGELGQCLARGSHPASGALIGHRTVLPLGEFPHQFDEAGR